MQNYENDVVFFVGSFYIYGTIQKLLKEDKDD